MKEAKAAEGGWTVVVHHKGRKKTTESETGTAVGSVSQAANVYKMANNKKPNEIVGHGFYRFQRRDAQRNGKSWLFLSPKLQTLATMYILILMIDLWFVFFSWLLDRTLGASE